MTSKDKQDVISVCRILADKMSDSGKVAVQQIIDAVKDMVENETCEDAISRVALLEELGEEPFNWNDSPEEFQEVRDYQWFRSLVENAPSVTPSYNSVKTELKPCEDYISREEILKEFQPYREYSSNLDNNGWVDRIETVIKMLPSVTPRQTMWIPVSEKNPSETGEYFTTIKWLDRENVYKYMVVKRDYFAEVDTWNDSLVIAWMPLPQPYKEVQDDT